MGPVKTHCSIKNESLNPIGFEDNACQETGDYSRKLLDRVSMKEV